MLLAWSVSELVSDMGDKIKEVAWDLIGSLAGFAGDLLNAVPVPEFMTDLQIAVGNIPPEVIYWAAPMELDYGLALISSALSARILMGMLPWIGGAFR